jgi:tetratricopeptide (TPR) repeat protein
MTMLATFPNFDVDVVALKGHCAYRRGDFEVAAGCFESAVDLGSQHPFVHLRLGKCYLKLDKVDAAKELFTLSWLIKISPETCLGVGVCLYRQKEYLEAERVLTTGSSLSHSNAQIWAYLALVHDKLKRTTEFQTCYDQAVRHYLNDAHLLKVLEHLQLSAQGVNVSSLTVCASKVSACDGENKDAG